MTTLVSSNAQEAHNFSTYANLQVVHHYAQEDELQEPEVAILAEIGAKIKGKRILDVGVGGGRTTRYLSKFSRHYVGVDYSEAMVNVCQRQFPDVSFLHADARELPELFEPGFFECIVFSFNGIDCVSHESRQAILKGFYQLLAPGGFLVFSSHNRAWNQLGAILTEGRGAYDKLRKLARFAKVSLKQLCKRHLETHTSEFAIVNDNDGVLVYCIDQQKQLAQLQHAGFDPLAVTIVDLKGQPVDPETRNRSSAWLYYLVQK